MHRPLVRHGDAGGDLGDIERRAAADADDEVLAPRGHACRLHMGELRLACEAGEKLRRYPLRRELCGKLLAKAAGGEEAVDDDERAPGFQRAGGDGDAGVNAFAETDIRHERCCECHDSPRNDRRTVHHDLRFSNPWIFQAF